MIPGASPREGKIVELLAGFQAEVTGVTLVFLGKSTLQLAIILLGLSLAFVPFASSRPRSTRRRQQHKARVRVAAVASAMGTTGLPSADQIVDHVAKRNKIVARTQVLLLPPIIVMLLGISVSLCGIILRDHARSPDGIPLSTLGSVFGLTAAFLIFFGASEGVRRWIWNQNPEFFATHHLLHAIELMLKLRPDASADGGTMDISQVRRDIVAELGQAARYVRRLIGRRRPFVGPEELDNARERAAQLARAISSQQETVIYGSLAEIFPLVPAVSRSLAALVEQRFGDLPLSGGVRLPADADERTRGAHGGTDDNRTDGSGELPHQSSSGRFRPEDVDTFRREIAQVYTTTASAEPMLTRAGYPRERRPNIDYHHPEAAWEEIFRDLGNGIIEDPFRTLLASALESYPANPIFTELAHRYDVPVPPSRRQEIPQRARRAKQRIKRLRF
ncbi:effector-associated domain EAD1-containing protein [Parafrankia sp. BMG5.11]|uniref:effector-associated domain EAD1-containing protein n=1 Tax=Parafrankia sp. BMG5.11 TaxID=222540 RepID=UPI000DA57C90|nr:effector-associated domain EAD1-containing protein [Parafrankia sp. BMG5.11]SQD96481.1 conserved membrane hypothetical protein [Parafrankia sp. Ea1.12]